MSDEAQRAGYRDLGVNSTGIGAEAVLYDDGDVTIQKTEFEGATPDGTSWSRNRFARFSHTGKQSSPKRCIHGDNRMIQIRQRFLESANPVSPPSLLFYLLRKESLINIDNPILLQNWPMDVDGILEKYGLTRDIATHYVDAISRMNQTETAEEISVSRDTINRYKNAFGEMTMGERLLVISSLTQEKLLENNTTSE